MADFDLAIIGGGSWGTALAMVLAPRFDRVRLWVYEPDLVERMRATRENDVYLPRFRVPDNVEVHNELEAESALALKGIRLLGINNRDLATFEISLATTERIRPMIPAGIAIISESGISTASDVQRLAAARVDAILVGEALVTSPDIASKVRELAGLSVKSYD